MSPNKRKSLSPKSKDFSTRFAIHLRKLLDDRDIGPADFRDKLQSAGLHVSIESVTKWLNGSRIPRPQDAPTIGRILALKDYRHLWPEV